MRTNNNVLKCSDYIRPDTEEKDVCSQNMREYQELLMKNRGIVENVSGGEYVKAREFAEYCLKSRIAIFRTENGTRYAYNYGKYMYEKISDNTLCSILLSIMDEYNKNILSSRVQEATIRFIDYLCLNYSSFPEETEYIVFSNGTYDRKIRKFTRNFSSEIKNLNVMSYEYDSNAECKKFCLFLEDIFNSDYEVINVIQEIFGYTLCYGKSYIDKFFYFYSIGRGGKSVLVNILRAMHGEERVSALSLDNLEQRFQLSTLVGKAVNITAEGSKSQLHNTSILKSLTGRDAVLIEEKYKKPYTTVLHTKLIVVANHYLSVGDDSFGFWQRVLPIHFPNVYLPLPSDGKKKCGVKYQKVGLEEELLSELSGIFNWAMKGLERLESNGWVFSYSKSIDKFKDKLMVNSRPIDIFVSECVIETSHNDKVKSSTLHSAFKDWCGEKNISIDSYTDARKFHSKFRTTLQGKGICYEVMKNSVDYYYGIQLKDDDE